MFAAVANSPPVQRQSRKQETPRRSLKQLASVAEKILHGIIVIDPILPWEQNGLPASNDGRANHRNPRGSASGKRKRRRSRSSENDESDDVSLGSPQYGQGGGGSNRPTVTRSPASMGNALPADSAEPGLSQRQGWYESILSKKRISPSRAGMPLDITAAPGASLLGALDFDICSTLRLYPLQYFQSRDTLVRNVRERGFYKKSAAQKMLHIDVNKTGKLYDYFVERGWMPAGPSDYDLSRVVDPPQVDWHPIEPHV